jgi:hypothetical protein
MATSPPDLGFESHPPHLGATRAKMPIAPELERALNIDIRKNLQNLIES